MAPEVKLATSFCLYNTISQLDFTIMNQASTPVSTSVMSDATEIAPKC